MLAQATAGCHQPQHQSSAKGSTWAERPRKDALGKQLHCDDGKKTGMIELMLTKTLLWRKYCWQICLVSCHWNWCQIGTVKLALLIWPFPERILTNLWNLCLSQCMAKGHSATPINGRTNGAFCRPSTTEPPRTDPKKSLDNWVWYGDGSCCNNPHFMTQKHWSKPFSSVWQQTAAQPVCPPRPCPVEPWQVPRYVPKTLESNEHSANLYLLDSWWFLGVFQGSW